MTSHLEPRPDPPATESPVASGAATGEGGHRAPFETGPGAGKKTALRQLLASYDRRVEASLHEALASTTGLERVRLLNSARHSLVVHDGVLRSALCPMLEDIPGGSDVADRLRRGCDERAELLRRFQALTKNVAAHNVYPVSGEEIEDILEGLAKSFDAHARQETHEVGSVLSAAAKSADPDVVAARMALEAERAPTRIHRSTTRHPGSAVVRGLYQVVDRWSDWHDSHNGWIDNSAIPRSPRASQVAALKQRASAVAPTVEDVLSGYDRTVGAVIEEWIVARTDLEKAEAIHRLQAAITVHDAVVEGVLGPLLDAVPTGKEVASRLREGCRRRAAFQEALNAVREKVTTEALYREHRDEVDRIVGDLIGSFRSHELEGTAEVTAVLGELPDAAYRTKTSALSDSMWPWHSEGPNVLALRMALWAEGSPTRSHPGLSSDPSSHTLRAAYRLLDHVQDSWGDSLLERWLLPKRPRSPGTGGHREESDTGSTPP